MHTHFRLTDQHPTFRTSLDRIEEATKRYVESARVARPATVVIPVVVHVVYNQAWENISDKQIRSQITVLNKDFRARNTDRAKVPSVWRGLVGDPGIEFSLHKVTRTKTTKTSFGTGDTVKAKKSGGADPVDPKKYLNIWVCSLGGGLLGYAQFPGGPKATDGVVILNTAFGTTGIAAAPFNKGRTTTHEIGHFLHLRHIWGDTSDCSGSDLVADTPTQRVPNMGKPKFPHITCGNGPHGDMFMNYMDYVDDAAMFMFTQGQVARMRATLAGPRSGLAKPKRRATKKRPSKKKKKKRR